MMLYANGQGVTRNYKFAKKAACSTDAATMEIVSWLQHLTNMGFGNEGANPKIDICDDITSGLMPGYWARIQFRFRVESNNPIRQEAVDRRVRPWLFGFFRRRR
jgi:hypothetical protein